MIVILFGVIVLVMAVFMSVLVKAAQYRHEDVIAWQSFCRMNGLPDDGWPPVGFGQKHPTLVQGHE